MFQFHHPTKKSMERIQRQQKCNDATSSDRKIEAGTIIDQQGPPQILPEFAQPRVPDGGYGWVIVFASFLCNFIVDGIGNSFGVFVAKYVAAFPGVSTGSVSWAGSILCGGYLCVGPIVSALTNKYGCRIVCIMGACIAATGLGLSSLAKTLPILILTYGIIGAMGFGMIYLPSIVSVGSYFERRRSMATGIAVCGSGVGTFVIAPIAAKLLQIMPWERVNLIFAGLILVCAGCGSLMRPLVGQVTLEIDETGTDLQNKDVKECESGYFMVHLPDGTVERRHKVPIVGAHAENFANANFTNANPNLIDSEGRHDTIFASKISIASKLSTTTRIKAGGSHSMFQYMGRSYSYRAVPLGFSTSSSSNPGNVAKKSQLSLQLANSKARLNSITGQGRDHNSSRLMNSANSEIKSDSQQILIRPLARKDVFYSGSVHNLPEYQSNASRRSLVSVNLTPGPQRDEEQGTNAELLPTQPKKEGPLLPKDNSFRKTFAEMMDFSLLKNPVFVFIVLSNIFGMLGFYIPLVYVVNAAVLKGVPINDATMLMSILGVANTVGRIATGVLSDLFGGSRSLLMYSICLLVSGLATICIPFCTEYGAFIGAIVIFALFISGFISLTSIILVDLLGLEKLTNAFGLVILFRGGAAILGAPLAGALFDAFGSYDVPFWVAGGFFLLSSLTSFMVPGVRRMQREEG